MFSHIRQNARFSGKDHQAQNRRGRCGRWARPPLVASDGSVTISIQCAHLRRVGHGRLDWVLIDKATLSAVRHLGRPLLLVLTISTYRPIGPPAAATSCMCILLPRDANNQVSEVLEHART